MSIHPGYSGQEFMPESLDRIRELRSELHERVVVQVDGGITHENVRKVHEAGAEAIVGGNGRLRVRGHQSGLPSARPQARAG